MIDRACACCYSSRLSIRYTTRTTKCDVSLKIALVCNAGQRVSIFSDSKLYALIELDGDLGDLHGLIVGKSSTLVHRHSCVEEFAC